MDLTRLTNQELHRQWQVRYRALSQARETGDEALMAEATKNWLAVQEEEWWRRPLKRRGQ